MAKIIFKVLLKFIKSVVNIIMTPINLLIVNLFPDLSSLVSNFNQIVGTYVGNGLSWFAHLLPPMTKNLIILYLGILISYYTITISVHAVIKVIHIIKKIKIW